MKEKTYIISFHSFIPVDGEQYTISGFLENVAYTSRGFWPCHVAMSDGGDKKYYYHATGHLEQCEFAERCKNSKIRVKILGADDGGLHELLSIEYADTEAKYLENPFTLYVSSS